MLTFGYSKSLPWCIFPPLHFTALVSEPLQLRKWMWFSVERDTRALSKPETMIFIYCAQSLDGTSFSSPYSLHAACDRCPVPKLTQFGALLLRKRTQKYKCKVRYQYEYLFSFCTYWLLPMSSPPLLVDTPLHPDLDWVVYLNVFIHLDFVLLALRAFIQVCSYTFINVII